MKFTDDYLLYLMAQASAAVSAEFHGWLESEGVAVGDWRILASLHPEETMSIGELATSCMVKQPTMTRMVDRLVRRSLVERTANGADRRRVAVGLTSEGRRLSERLVAEAQSHERRLLARFDVDPADLKALLRSLARRGA